MTRLPSRANRRPAGAQRSASGSGGRLINALLVLGVVLLLGVVALIVFVYITRRAQSAPAPRDTASSVTHAPPQINIPGSTPLPVELPTVTPSATAASASVAALNTVPAPACGIRAGLFAVHGDAVSVEIFNDGAATLEMADLALDWPAANGRLTEIRFGESKIATLDDPAPSTHLPVEFGWNDAGNRGLAASVSKTLNFQFSGAAQPTGYSLNLIFDNHCGLVRTDSITDTPSPTPTITLTYTPTATLRPTNTVTPGPSPTPTVAQPTTTESLPVLGPTFTPGCSIVLGALEFKGASIFMTVSNREAAPVTLTKLRVAWGETELDLIRLGDTLIWNAEDFRSPTIIPEESRWLGEGRTIDGGQTTRLELVFEGSNALPGVYHSIDMTFDNGCFRSASD